ncbi:hypothetical protein L6164_029568 [Bauhinia variegata]|uniref:Uncharacterized protein n=1 Tax=Bauhinia variegata TaxID=167791 RepID=A0ACB9L9X7_BAUVA|nr:hypothetical protein L6164_029568 [Bauhinia variegata]
MILAVRENYFSVHCFEENLNLYLNSHITEQYIFCTSKLSTPDVLPTSGLHSERIFSHNAESSVLTPIAIACNFIYCSLQHIINSLETELFSGSRLPPVSEGPPVICCFAVVIKITSPFVSSSIPLAPKSLIGP